MSFGSNNAETEGSGIIVCASHLPSPAELGGRSPFPFAPADFTGMTLCHEVEKVVDKKKKSPHII